jgi:hypothetical protein
MPNAYLVLPSRRQRHVPAALAVLRADAAIARDVVALIEG